MIRSCRYCGKNFERLVGAYTMCQDCWWLKKNPYPEREKFVKKFKKPTLISKDKFKENIRARDNKTCQKCGEKWQEGQRPLDVHHLNPLRENRGITDWDILHPEELITLCHKCHLGLPHLREKMRVNPTFDKLFLA